VYQGQCVVVVDVFALKFYEQINAAPRVYDPTSLKKWVLIAPVIALYESRMSGLLKQWLMMCLPSIHCLEKVSSISFMVDLMCDIVPPDKI
jgi:hypothetical protein